ncbi:MAG: hemerythrin domain-containing protein [Chitinophagaceae bacterium]|nr:hemerythrin domain-containing protein [Chitinophagaceae bacterium]
MMEQEHDHTGSMLAEIRNLTNNYNPPADACTTYQLSFASLQAFELDLHRHVHLENNILFPKALKMFGSQINISLN